MIDSFIYASSSLAGVFGVALYERLGENALYLSFFASAAVSALLMHAAGKMNARYWGGKQPLFQGIRKFYPA